MALVLNKATGTQTATIGTEHTLDNDLDAGIYVLFVNLKNMVNGDIVVLRGYAKVLTGDANPLLVFEHPYGNVQGDAAAPGSEAHGAVVAKSPPLESPFSITWTLTQEAGGAGRDFPWRIDQLA